MADVNLRCAYLRMPFDGGPDELQVRKAAQRILTLHLRPAETATAGSGRTSTWTSPARSSSTCR
ncbi:hypothetical protein ABZU76_02535 [Amycolatopsis sp. NPDC005232]|uniref:hypothetical protein n=1 Tax=Amycolatopsis sp. NPDC005232 TaxID=3157027 RepID=UPI0033B180E2